LIALIFETAILFAITVVVITCPDALGLATPIAIMGRHRAGGQAWDPLQERRRLGDSARIQAVVMDKTGTL